MNPLNWLTAVGLCCGLGLPHPAGTSNPPQEPVAVTPPSAPSGQPQQEDPSKSAPPKQPVPPLTDEDRAAAFPEGLHGHKVHDGAFNYLVLFDQVEWQGAGSGGANLENTTWIGGDINRMWLRAEGESESGRVEHAQVAALWGHSISRWWDVVAGVRQDFRPGDPQTWLAFGIQGLAPQWFDVEATGYVGARGRTEARLEMSYHVLMTNRLIAEPKIELEIAGKGDPQRHIAAGLSSLETGVRVRYELRRELAPYIGVSWHRKLFGTADLARESGERAGRPRFVVGLRTWF